MSGKLSGKTIILFILIFFAILLMIISTYAYFNYRSIPETNDEDNRINVIFNDNSSIALVNAKKGDNINKNFVVKNTTDKILYYNIEFNDLVNNYGDNKDIVYSLISNKNGAYINNSYMPLSSEVVASNIKINAKEEHQYSLNITINESQKDNTTFSTNINVKVNEEYSSFEKDTLGYKILNNNSIKSLKNLDTSELVEGLYYTNNTNDGKTIYFFRGSKNLNNNVLIDKTCYKIIRTTEDNGVRIIYNGEINDGICDGSINVTGESEYNSKSNYNAYVGFMYGTANSGTYEKEHQNVNSSKIKTYLDTYYSNNLNKYSSIIANSIYCSNRKTSKFTYGKVNYGINGYKNDNTGYDSMYKFINNINTYKCDLVNDKLHVDILSNPIGLLTSDEALYAGINDERILDNYLNSENSYWTMTPAYFNGVYAYNFIIKDGKLTQSNVSEKHGVRPVITLKNSVKVKSGNGSDISPYVVY